MPPWLQAPKRAPKTDASPNFAMNENLAAMIEDVILSLQNLHLEEKPQKKESKPSEPPENLAAMIEDLIVSLQKLHLKEKLQKKPKPPQPPPPPLKEVEEMTGYTFRNKELLKEAFTHGSYKAKDCQSYERLEYLGDSVLNHLVAKLHYFAYPKMAPGELTKLRAANVDTEALARAAMKYQLHKYVRHQKPLLQRQIQEFTEGIKEYPSHSHGMIDPPKVLADLLESLIGAIFIDTDWSMDSTWEVIHRMLHPLITPENLKRHPVAKFNEACQKMGVKPQAKDLWSKTGEIEIYINDKLVGSGKYKLKKMIAVNRAAADAYNNLFEKKDGGKAGG